MAIQKKSLEGKVPAGTTKTKGKSPAAPQKAPKLETAMRTTKAAAKADIFKI